MEDRGVSVDQLTNGVGSTMSGNSSEEETKVLKRRFDVSEELLHRRTLPSASPKAM